ncbi:MAG: RHS repeat-associated core domain-containing protein, partial [Acidobacteriota bacterium]
STLGRFISPDPFGGGPDLGRPGSWNKYSYVEGDPVNYYDPAGLLLAKPGDDTHGGGGGGTGWGFDSTMFGFLMGGGWRPEPREPAEPREGGGGNRPTINPDALVGDQKVMESLYCLWVKGGYGFQPTERATWITKQQGDYGTVPWPWSAEAGKESWKGPPPIGSVAIVHTHPDNRSPKPSTTGGVTRRGDQGTADAINLPVYVVTRNAIWKAVPGGKEPLQVVEGEWWKPFQEAKLKCPD